MPRLTVSSELESGALVAVSVPELQMDRTLRLVYRRGAALSHAARAFLLVAEQYANERGEPFLFAAERS